jgi:outer membrane protein TolC
VFEARARVSQTVLDPSALGRVRGARTSVQAAGADLANVADQAAAGAANAYLMVLRADAVVTARLADSTLAAELLGIAQDQLRAGTGVALDVTRARSQLTGARTQLIVARNDRDRNHVELARALGLPLVRLELADSLASMPLSTTAAESAALGAAIRGRKDLQSIELQARAAREQAAAIRNERLPTIGVFADEGISQRNGRSYLPTYDWGIQLSLPIFDGLRREGRVEEQLSVARDLASRERDLRTQVEADVRIAVLNLTSSAEAVAAARERLGLAEQEVAQARERFQAGVAGNADVITASLTLNNARTQYVDALASYHAARVALARAQGSITTLE